MILILRDVCEVPSSISSLRGAVGRRNVIAESANCGDTSRSNLLPPWYRKFGTMLRCIPPTTITTTITKTMTASTTKIDSSSLNLQTVHLRLLYILLTRIPLEIAPEEQTTIQLIHSFIFRIRLSNKSTLFNVHTFCFVAILLVPSAKLSDFESR